MSAVWAIFLSAILGATFTAILVWILTIRQRRLDREKSKATIYYAGREAEIAAREIKNRAEIEIERRWTELHGEKERVKIELESLRREISRDETALKSARHDLDEKLAKFERDANSLRQARQAVSNMMRLYRRRLQGLAGISVDEARKLLLEETAQECQDELRAYRRDVLEKGDSEINAAATKILLTAMQRISTQSQGDTMTAVINLPNEEMKGRIIGREGRNIKCFEAVTGTTLLIDDSPQTLLISSFDPVRREIAKVALESLIEDGRIHPASIEEHLAKANEQVMAQVARYGEDAVDRLKLTGVNHETLTLLGKLRYRFSLNQNVLDHSIEVAFLCSMLASELGLDPVIAKRAGLFHDIGKALEHEYEGSHALAGADFLRRRGEPHSVVNAVAAHHEESPPETPYAPLLIIGDTISAGRPGARAEPQSNYIERLERLERLASCFPGVRGAYAIQAGREIRVIVSPDEIDDEEARKLAKNLREKIEDELQYPSIIKVTVIREQRFTETAR